jgi:hypothetical protein
MLGRRELLVLLVELELALLQCAIGISRCSSRAAAMATFSKFSSVTAAFLDVLTEDDGDEEEVVEDDEDEEEDGKDGRRMSLTCSSSSASFGRGAARIIL